MILDSVNFLATVFSGLFLLLVCFQLFVFFIKKERSFKGKYLPSVTVLVPCHNEGKYLRETLESILSSDYAGKLNVWVLDDGSTDKSPEIAKEFKSRGVKCIKTPHIGKSNALNNALKKVRTEIVMTIDGDTKIEKGSIEKMVLPFQEKQTGATTGVIKARVSKKPITWFQRIEYLGFVFYKRVCNKLNALIVASGPLSAYRTKYLKSVNGFSPYILSEDFDAALKLIKKGYRVYFVKDAVCWTQVPEKVRVLSKQRLRWGKGGIHVLKTHSDMWFNPKYKWAGFFSIPLLLYGYFHSTIMGTILLLQIFLGYYSWFYSYGVVVSIEVIKYFFYWFSVFGIINLAYNIWVGVFPLTALNLINILIVSFNYLLFGVAVKTTGEKFGWKDLFVFVFLFPYWMLLLVIQIFTNLEWFKEKGRNWWKK